MKILSVASNESVRKSYIAVSNAKGVATSCADNIVHYPMYQTV